jgi:hypothetical protein
VSTRQRHIGGVGSIGSIGSNSYRGQLLSHEYVFILQTRPQKGILTATARRYAA